MEGRKIVVVVEDVEAARTALKWALHNLCRYGDVITLLHVFSSSSPSSSSSSSSSSWSTRRSRRRLRLLRLNGFQLALSFQDICNSFLNTNVEIIVTEGDEDGGKIASMVREIGASTLVVGLHDRSFLYKLAMDHDNVATNFNCKVLAIKQPTPPPGPRRSITPAPESTTSSLDFSQIEIARLELPELPTPKIPYKICPDPYAIIWRWRKKSRRRRSPSSHSSQMQSF